PSSCCPASSGVWSGCPGGPPTRPAAWRHRGHVTSFCLSVESQSFCFSYLVTLSSNKASFSQCFLCFLCVFSVFPQCFLCVSSVFPQCFLCVSSVFPQCFLSVSSVFTQCFLCVSSVFPQCFLCVSSV
uniref:Uncharacterized protein n=1 Tax=Gasterosteus aculeatus TaxID=69293 RepID=G3N7U9_GASAC